jgi:hypothetical protein
MHVLTDDQLVKLQESGFNAKNFRVGEFLMWCEGVEKPCGVLINSTTSCMETATTPAYCSDCIDSHE